MPIASPQELRDYLEADRAALGKHYLSPKLFGDEIWKFQIALRKSEYYEKRGGLDRLRFAWYRLRAHRLGVSLGYSIPRNVIGPGLCLAHYGSIVVSEKARIGSNCRIHSCVNIGVAHGGDVSATIGDNVYIGPGAKLFGAIVIADNCTIGANAVVNKSFAKPGSTIVGVPGRALENTDKNRQ